MGVYVPLPRHIGLACASSALGTLLECLIQVAHLRIGKCLTEQTAHLILQNLETFREKVPVPAKRCFYPSEAVCLMLTRSCTFTKEKQRGTKDRYGRWHCVFELESPASSSVPLPASPKDAFG